MKERKNPKEPVLKDEPETLRESSEPVRSLIEVGGSMARMQDSVLISTKADEISKLVTNQEESKKVFDDIIKLSKIIMHPQDTPREKTEED